MNWSSALARPSSWASCSPSSSIRWSPLPLGSSPASRSPWRRTLQALGKPTTELSQGWRCLDAARPATSAWTSDITRNKAQPRAVASRPSCTHREHFVFARGTELCFFVASLDLRGARGACVELLAFSNHLMLIQRAASPGQDPGQGLVQVPPSSRRKSVHTQRAGLSRPVRGTASPPDPGDARHAESALTSLHDDASEESERP